MKLFNLYSKKIKIAILASLFLLVTVSIIGSVVVFAAGPITVNLGTARNFLVLSKEGSTNTPISPSVILTPKTLLVALNDMQNAYIKMLRRTDLTATDLGAGNIDGITFTPGLYKWSTGVTIPTDITLSGGSNDIFVFQVGGNLNESPGKNIFLSGGLQAQNIFWQVEGKTTIGAGAIFNGNILDNQGIVLNENAKLNGRALSKTAVTLYQGSTVALGESSIVGTTPVPVFNTPTPVETTAPTEAPTTTIPENVSDTIPPVISLNGDALMNLKIGDVYTEPGATAKDNVDASVTVVEGGSVDTAVAGTYTITYNATDSAGNHATEVTRTVNVVTPIPESAPLFDVGLSPGPGAVSSMNAWLIFVGALIVVFLFFIRKRKK